MKYRYRTDEEMKDSGVEWIGKIPINWGTNKLKNVSRIYGRIGFRGYTVNDLVDEGEGAITLSPSNIEEQKLVLDKKTYLSWSKYEESPEIKIFNGDIIFVKTASVGKIAIVENLQEKATINPQFIVFKNITCNRKFLYYILISDVIQQQIKQGSNGGVLATLAQQDINNYFIIYNSLEEQIKIAQFLDEKTSQFDSIISKKEALIEKLEEAKKSLISEVVTGKVKVVKTEEGYDVAPRSREEMKDSGVEWLGLLPKKWDVKRLRFLGTLQNGISKSSEEFGYGFPFVSYGDVYRNMSLPQFVNGLVNSSANDRKIYSVEQGDVFFTRTSETIDEIGISSVCLESIPEATFAGFLIRFRPNSKLLFKGFSKYYFRCILNRNYFVKEMNLVTRASLSQNLLNNLSVVLPTYEDQENIYWGLEYKIGTIDNIIEKIKSEIQKLKEAKQSLIAEAVTGKIEILD